MTWHNAKNHLRLAVISVVAVTAISQVTRAEIPESAYAKVNRALTTGVAVPGYARLKTAAARFRLMAAGYCGGTSNTGLAQVRGAYQRTMDAWMNVQAIGFGPVELFMRNFRLYFWPSPGGRIGKSLEEVIAGAAPIATENLRRSSVAVQGLPAAEILLFGPKSAALLPRSRRCELLMAIGQNVEEISASIFADWSGGNRTGGKTDFSKSIMAPGSKNPLFASSKEVSLAYFKSLHQGLELIVAAKLGPLLKQSSATSQSPQAESRLSARSLRNIVLNLQAAQSLYLGPKDDGFTAIVRSQKADMKLDALMRRAFRLTIATAKSIKPPLATAITDPEQRKRLEKLLLQTRALKQIVATRLAKALGLAVGFNSLDGD